MDGENTLKANIYILATLLIVSTVLLLSSCGSNNPLSAPSSTAGNPNNLVPTAFSSGPRPIPLPAWIESLPPASIACILQNPHLNLNATSPNKKPFNQLCGDYQYVYAKASFVNSVTIFPSPYTISVSYPPGTVGVPTHTLQVRYSGVIEVVKNLTTGQVIKENRISNAVTELVNITTSQIITPFPLDIVSYYTIPCNDPCLMGGSFPEDAFTGSGAPDAPLIGSDGTIYGKGKPPIPPDPTKPRKLIWLSVDPDTASISVGGTTSFTATAMYNLPPITEPVTNQMTSGNPAVATISNGTVTGVASGQAALKVTLGGYSAVSVVDVGNASGPKTLTNITINPPTQTVGVGQTASFSATAHYSDGSTKDVTANPATLWSTQISGFPNTNPPGTAVAYTAPATTTSTNKNTPSGLSAPSAMTAPTQPGIFTSSVQAVMTIIAEYTEGGVKKSAQATATFDKKSIQITPLQATIYIHHANPDKKQQQFIAKDGNGTDVTQQLLWDTSDATVANVSNFDIHKGLTFAGNKAGTVKISATDIPTGIKSDPDAELCVECREYVYYSQNDPAWKDNIYAYHKAPWLMSNVTTTVGDVGCAMTAYAMVFSTVIPSNQLNTSPGIFDLTLTTMEIYDHRNNYVRPWLLPAISSNTIKGYADTSPDFINWKSYLDKCHVIVGHLYSGNNNGHYVLIFAYDQNTGLFKVYDPLRGAMPRLLTISDFQPEGNTVLKLN